MLKNAIIEMREGLFEGKGVNFSELIKNHRVNEDELLKYHKAIKIWKSDSKKNMVSTTGRKIWSEGEKKILVDYLESDYNKLNEKGKVKTKSAMFEELSEIFIGRTKDTIGFYFYSMNEEEKNKLRSGDIDTINEKYTKGEDEVTNVKQEAKEEFDNEQMSIEEEQQEPKVEENGDDLLDSMIELVNNMDKFGDTNIASMIKGLSQLSKLAVQDDGKDDQIKSLESEISNLKKENRKLSSQLEVANEKYDVLADEVKKFGELNSTDKIRYIKDYDSKVKSLVNVQ